MARCVVASKPLVPFEIVSEGVREQIPEAGILSGTLKLHGLADRPVSASECERGQR
jgi:hypothetical protein